jgi:hypothetical protein
MAKKKIALAKKEASKGKKGTEKKLPVKKETPKVIPTIATPTPVAKAKAIEKTPLVAKAPAVKQPKIVDQPNVAEKPKAVEVTAKNIGSISKSAPTADQVKAEKEISQTIVEKLSGVPEVVHTNPLLVYSDSIRDAIRNHFRLMSRNEINDLMLSGNYPFTYEMKQNPAQPTNQIFIEITSPTDRARIPNNEDDFINVNG